MAASGSSINPLPQDGIPAARPLFVLGFLRAFIVCSLALLLAGAAAAEERTLFTRTGKMHAMRSGHCATLMENGNVLVTGGAMAAAMGTTCEVFDSRSGVWTLLSATLAGPRAGHTATRLPGGKILLTGGSTGATSGDPLATAELFDPATETFMSLPPMTTARLGHTATLLPNGKVLIAGGITPHPQVITAELFDPALQTFTSVGVMPAQRKFHSATLLHDGTVLLAGGSSSTGPASADLFYVETATFTPAASEGMLVPRTGHSATLLSDGKVLIAGGYSAGSSSGMASIQVSELYDPAARRFTATAGQPMRTPRRNHTATQLGDGRVLLAGGCASYLRTETAELYDPQAESFTTLFPHTLREMREYHTATALPDGRVLIVGGATGFRLQNEPDLAGDTTELFDLQAMPFAVPTQTLTIHRRKGGGGLYLSGKTTPRRAVTIQSALAGWGFQYMATAVADETGAFIYELPPPGDTPSALLRMSLAE
jgi:hypothetical protein